MNQPLVLELASELQRYLASHISLSEFRDWFDSATWDIDEESILLRQITREIELRLAEYSNGHWTEGELRDMFTPLLTIAAVSSRPSFSTGASSVTSSPATDPRSGFGIRFEEAISSGAGLRK